MSKNWWYALKKVLKYVNTYYVLKNNNKYVLKNNKSFGFTMCL